MSFNSSAEIVFGDHKGRSVLWYAISPNGGFDLYETKSKGLFLVDGRELELADTPAERQRIGEWVDAQAAQRQAELKLAEEREATANAEKAANEAKAAENAKAAAIAAAAEKARLEQEELARKTAAAEEHARETERARIAGYVAALPNPRVNFAVFFVDASSKPSPLATFTVASSVARNGRTAAGNVFADGFAVPEGFDRVVSGKGASDVAAMRLAEGADRLLLLRGGVEEMGPSGSVPGVQTYSMSVTAWIVEAGTGKLLNEFVIADVTGAGVSAGAAKSAFFERIAEVVAAKRELQDGLR